MADRRFDDKETAKVLRKAAELQAGAKKAKSEHGSSEAEIRAAAREIGLDPKYVDQALAELDAEPFAAPTTFWGGPLTAEFDQTFEGEMDDDAWEDMVADLRKTFGYEGKVELRGSTREWNTVGAANDWSGGNVTPVTVTVRQLDGKVRIVATTRLDGLATIIYIMSCLPFIIGIAVLVKGLALAGMFAAGAIALLLMSIFWASRMIVNAGAKSHIDKLQRAVSRMGHRLGESGPRVALESAPPRESNSYEITEQA